MHDKGIVFPLLAGVKWPHLPDCGVIRPNDRQLLRHSAHASDAPSAHWLTA